MAIFFPVGSPSSGMNTLSLARSISARNDLRYAMEIGSSTSCLLHASSQGWGQTLPIHAGSGNCSLISLSPSLYSMLAASPTYPWQSVYPGQARTHGGLQSPTWSERRSSSAVFLELLTLSVFVFIIIPSEAVVAHDLRSFGTPSTSTTHIPHDPYISTLSSKHMVGISILLSLAMSSIV